MAMIEVLLNGNKIQVEDNITILDLARNNNIEIPTLCKDPRLKPITSCFLCVVEVKGAKTLTPSCSTYITNGMEINTNTDRVMEARKTALELILSNHYGDCLAPCKLACPAGCDVQGYVGLIANGRYKEAIKLIKETIPLPAAIGRVCPKFCEDKCRRQLVDKSIAIDYLKRFAADIDLSEEDSYMPDLKPKIGKKVAVIGGGPAGLSCAYYLVQEGVDVEIFEAKSTLGGMLVYGIPEYRLPKELTAKEIDLIIKLGVKVNLNKRLGKDFTIDDLKKQGFDAVLLSMGAWKSRKMDVENENTEGVFDGIKYLEELNEGKDIKLNGRVAIVGGGNTAFDCARTALRIGASEVVVVYRRTRDEMPANDIEIIEAEEEGIKYEFLTAPVKIISENGKVTGMECVKMKLGEPDASGRRSPVVIEGSNFIEKFDYVIAAVGQSPDYSYLGDYKDKLLKGGRWINFNKDTMQTDVDFIFTAGDYAIGAATVVEALGTGKKACNSIVKFLKKDKLDVKKEFVSTRDEFNEITQEFLNKWEKQERQKPDILPPEIRKHSFDEIEDVFTEEQALIESKRCMECGCMDVYQCDLKKYSTEYNAKETKYLGDFNRFEDDASHEFIYREPEKCILCGRCVALCKDLINIGVYGFIDRGFTTIVGPAYKDKLANTDCISCGLCVDGCPVGAIVPKTLKNKKIPLKGKMTDSNCFHCSIGCDNTIETVGKIIYEIHERPNYLCGKGKFKYPDNFIDINGADYEVIKKSEGAIVYPSPNLSAEDYEALKIVGKKYNWQFVNYYSQSTLFQAFASEKILPKMDFFNNDLKEKSLIIVAGNIETNHPIAINRLSEIIKKDTRLILINKNDSIRLNNLGAELIESIEDIENINLKDYSEIVLLINPIDFDEVYGADSALMLYNYFAESGINLRTTLFSLARNLYSLYDADKIVDVKGNKEIFINTVPFDNSKNFIRFDSIKNNKELSSGLILPLPYSFQSAGSFYNSKNRLYKNNPVLENKTLSLSEILCNILNIKLVNKINQLKNIDMEKPFAVNYDKTVKFPKDSFINSFK